MAEFKERLKDLMNEQNIKAEELSRKLGQEITANTVRNYLKGDTSPRDMHQIQILANYFNVSIDYLQGYTENPNTDVNIKNISNEYGLSDKSLKYLHARNRLEKKEMANRLKKYGISTIDTINFLLENSNIIALIDGYFNAEVNENYLLGFIRNGDIALYDKRKDKRLNGHSFVNADVLEKTFLLVIEKELIEMKEKIKNKKR